MPNSSTGLPQAPTARRLIARGVALVLIVAIALVGLAAWHLTKQRADVLQLRSDQLSNLSASLRWNAENSVRVSSAILMGVMDQYRFGGDESRNVARMRATARKQAALYPEIQGIFFYDVDGRWIMTTISDGTPLRYNADRGYFQHHQSSPGREPFIGPPIKSRSTDAWVFTITHRYEDDEGKFAGVALATIDLQHYLNFYLQLELSGGIVNLVRTDGTLLVRHPFRVEDLAIDFSKSPAAKAIEAGSSRGVLTFNSIVDNARRVLAYSASDTFPLYVSVGVEEQEILTTWRSTLWVTITAIGVALLLILILAWRAFIDMRARSAAEAAVVRSNQRLASLNETLETLASEDALTGIANRRQFDIVLNKATIHAEMSAEALSLILIDIDYFKLYNDRYGHQAGDSCLRQVASIIKSLLHRPADLPARYGGEELAVVLPHTDQPGALGVAERIRQAIESANMLHEDSSFGVVTVSVGVATCGPVTGCFDYSALVSHADSALYLAKREGRNRVAVYCPVNAID